VGSAPDHEPSVVGNGDAATQWVLVRQTPRIEQLGLDAGVAELRHIDAQERTRIRAAEAVFDRFGAKWGHTEMIRRAMALDAAVDALREAQLRALGALNQADIARVQSAFVHFVEHVASWPVLRQQMTGHPAAVASSVVQLPPLAACRGFAADTGRVVVAFVEQQGRPPVLAAMRRDEHGQMLGEAHDLVALVNATVEACELFSSAELVAAEDALLEAGRGLLSVQAEVLYGYPAFAPAPFDPLGVGRLELEPIGVTKVTTVMYALEVARTRLASWRPETAPREPGAAGIEPSADDTTFARAASAVETDPRPEPADATTGDEAIELSIGDESRPEGATQQPVAEHTEPHATRSEPSPPRPSQPIPPPAVDLRGPLEEALALSEDAERRWFEALGQSMSGDAGDLKRRMQSLLRALTSEIQAAADRDTASGLSAVLPELPLGADDANRLEVDPGGQQRTTQHGIGLIAVVENLVQALKELDRPTAVQVQFPSGAATTWWSPDVFTRIRDAAKLAIRFSDDPSGAAASERTNMLDRSLAAWIGGLPEAAAMYLVCALDATAERQGPLAAAFETLCSLMARLVAGTPVPLDTLVPVIYFWLQEVQRRTEEASPGEDGRPGWMEA
jgi:hypothetical protein